MMPGKRSGRPGGHPMRRTTSLTEFAPPDVLAAVAAEQQQAEEEDDELHLPVHVEEDAALAEKEDPFGWTCGGGSGGNSAANLAAGSGRSSTGCWMSAYRARAAPALLGLRRNSADFSAAETAAFLRACGLCNRRLGPGRDTFMYRGDTAFCSLECRQQHITIEEWKEKCTALATTTQADDHPVKPPASETPNKSAAAAAVTATATAGGGGGMLAAA